MYLFVRAVFVMCARVMVYLWDAWAFVFEWKIRNKPPKMVKVDSHFLMKQKRGLAALPPIKSECAHFLLSFSQRDFCFSYLLITPRYWGSNSDCYHSLNDFRHLCTVIVFSSSSNYVQKFCNVFFFHYLRNILKVINKYFFHIVHTLTFQTEPMS